MGYRLEAGESVTKGLRRTIREEIESARDYLAGKEKGGPDEAIHEARKSLKKIRAVMRLVQDELGAVYRKENDALRAIATELTELRDAAAMIETFDALPGADQLQSVRAGLLERKRETEASKDRDAVIKEAGIALRRLDTRAKTWPIKTEGFAAIAPGLEDRYCRGRKAMGVAKDEQTPESFHEWRKRVKDHWYHTRLIENLWTEEMQAREKSLKDLETWLGEDHNLSVMRGLIAGEPARFGEPKTVEAAMDAIDTRQNELRDNALALGARLYEEKPKVFVKRIADLWKQWESEPARRKPAASATAPVRKRAHVA